MSGRSENQRSFSLRRRRAVSRATDLLTDDGQRLPLGKRTGAVMMEVYALRERIDRTQKGQIEIVIDFKNGYVTPSVRESGESRKID